MFNKGDLYKNFECLNVFDIVDFHSRAVHLVHKKTGLEIVHFVNDDEENLFSFSFRTPNPKSNGAAHILEHSVLCGSEKYPLKDPFVVLSNQSVKTYLNAMTYPDRTVFPASSIIKTDYFNLMDVYGDAVFFPRLDYEIFMQEAHRLEIDENGNPSIQGVVFNEMKGDYSSFESIVSNACNESLLKGSVYEKDSGGDPLDIPSITHSELKEFHRKWYRPNNCLVFLYGNIPTEEQLDFLQEKFLDRLEKKFPEIDYSSLSSSDLKLKKKEEITDFLKYVTPIRNGKAVEIKTEGPGENESSNTVVVNWSFGSSPSADLVAENTFLTGILLNHDGSPLQKVLTECDLGEDIAPQSGFAAYLYDSILSVGLRGVKNGNEKKVEKLIFDTLENLIRNGISKNDIESMLMSFEFSQRSIKRLDGPYSKTLMGRIVYGWLYGYDLSEQIRQRAALEKIKEKIKNEPRFLEEKIKKLLLDNPNRSLVVVSPSVEFNKKRNEEEKKILGKLLEKTSIEKIKEECKKLHEFQKKIDDNSCIPHLNPKDFLIDGKPVINRIKTEIIEFEGVDFSETSKKIPVFKNVENTNGIVYFQVGFPVDVLDVADYPYIPLFTDACVDSGWIRRSDGKFLDWAESSEVCALHTGGLGCSQVTTDTPFTVESKKMIEKSDYIGRDWIVFRLSMLEEETENGLEILADCLTGTDFHDLKRLSDSAIETKNDFESSIVPDGHIYTSLRTKVGTSRSSTVDEIWNGITQFYTLHEVASDDKEKIGEISKKYMRMFSEVKNGGAFIQIIAEKNGIEKVCSILPKFINDVGLKSLKTPRKIEENALEKLTILPQKIGEQKDATYVEKELEIFVFNSQVGFASSYSQGSPYGTEDEAVEDLCAHWLSNNLLWERIRTVGGAYGAFSSTDPIPGAISFSTYRDPKPFISYEMFEKCLEEASTIDFNDDEVEKAIVGNYSHWIQPQTPKGRGVTAMIRTLSGICDIDRENKIRWLLQADSKKLKRTFKSLLEKSRKSEKFKKKSVILSGRNDVENFLKNESFDGKIIYLPI